MLWYMYIGSVMYADPRRIKRTAAVADKKLSGADCP